SADGEAQEADAKQQPMGIVEHLPAGQKPYDPPRPIEASDRLDVFDCGKPPLNDFLRQRALKNEGRASRAYVVCANIGPEAAAVIAFYTLSASAIAAEHAPGWAKRNMPNPIPVMLIGRMA